MEKTDNKHMKHLEAIPASMQGIQDVQINDESCWQESDEDLHKQEVVWQIEANNTSKQPALDSNVVHNVPITYLTSSNPNLVFSKTFKKPVTYIVSDNGVMSEKIQNISNIHEQQELLVVQQKYILESDCDNVGLNYAKVYKVDGCKQSIQTPLYISRDNVDDTVDIVTVEPDYKTVEEQIECTASEVADSKEVEMDITEQSEPKLNDEKGGEGRKDYFPDTARTEEILVKGVRDSSVKKKVNRIGRNKDERKSINGRKKVKKRNVNSKGRIKQEKKVGRFAEKKLKSAMTESESTDDKKEKTKLKVKRNPYELTKLEERAEQVAERFKIGCECMDYNCFEGLNPEKVFRHRLNIADLTKAEHDMYLMGVIMSSMQNPEETSRHKERLRIRSTYVYQGKRVCLTAFLYLEHVTLYQMKRLRKHLKYHGVSPRTHGNRGRKPANTLSLDTYQHATLFVQRFIEKNYVKSVPNFTTFSSNKIVSPFVSGTNLNLHEIKNSGKEPHTYKIVNKMNSYHLPPDCTKKTLHDEYKSFCEGDRPDDKIMQYSTFTSFLKKQFPNVKFQKVEKKQEERGVVGAAGGKAPLPSSYQAQSDRSRIRVKKLKRPVSTVGGDAEKSQSEEKRRQSGKVFVSGKTIQIAAPSQLIVAPKQSSFIAKGQIIGNAVIKAPQIVTNGQHIQICRSQSQTLQSDVRLTDQVSVGDQLVNVPSYTQHVYTMHNISSI